MEWSTSRISAALLRNRRFVRSPIPLYRHGFGALVGNRILMLEHLGRRTGQPRYVCLEVVERAAPDRILVASGFGTTSQWYRNLRADQDCFVSVGSIRRRPAHARLLDAGESVEVLGRYQQAHPGAWRRLRAAIEVDGVQDPDELPMVELNLAGRDPA